MEADGEPRLVLRRQSLDPDGKKYSQIVGLMDERSSEEGTTLEGFADVQPDGTLRCCSAEPALGAFPILARWAVDNVSTAPQLRRLVGARYAYLDEAKRRLVTEWNDDALWTGLASPDAAQAALIGDVIAAAGPRAPLRVWLAPAQNDQPARMLVQDIREDEDAFNLTVRKMRGMSNGQRGVRATLTAHNDHMLLNTVEKNNALLTQVAAMVRANLDAVPALGTLINLQLCLRDPKTGKSLRVLNQPKLWKNLKAPRLTSGQQRLQSLANSLRADTEKVQFWFDPTLAASRVPMVLIPQDEDLKEAVTQALGADRAKRKTAIRGQAKRNGTGLIFRAKKASDDFLAALGALVSTYVERAPELATLKGSRFKAIDAEGNTLQKQHDDQMWAFA